VAHQRHESELAAMVISFVVAVGFQTFDTGLEGWEQLVVGVAITTVGWVAVTFLTNPTEQGTLVSFYKHIRPAPGGWKPVIDQAKRDGKLTDADVKPGKLPIQILCMFIGCFTVYGALFAVGYFLYGNMGPGLAASGVAIAGGWLLFRFWKQMKDA
jgi:SSS family solute:Na+ symporter